MLLKILCVCLLSQVVFSKPQQDGSLDDLINGIFTKSPDEAIVTPAPPPPPTPAVQPPVPVPDSNQNEDSEDYKPCNGATGVCVPYYLCSENNTVIQDGSTIIDIRFGEEDTTQKCVDYFEQCCGSNAILPEKPKIPPIDVHENGCGYRNVEGVGFRITGNRDNEAEFGEFPWMVAVTKDEQVLEETLNVYQCGGALINPSVVLTAAHCVQNKQAKLLKIRAGEWDTQTKNEIVPHQDRDVIEVIVHEEYYKGALYNDFALLILSQPVEMLENIGMACLPPQNDKFDGSRCFASGWGKDVFGKEGKYQVILKKIELPVVPNDQCQKKLRSTRLGKYFTLHPSFICAGGEVGKDTCKGDGGSPLVCPIPGAVNRYYQAGIVAWGIGCGENQVPGVYANVAGAREWVDKKFALKNIDSSSYKFH